MMQHGWIRAGGWEQSSPHRDPYWCWRSTTYCAEWSSTTALAVCANFLLGRPPLVRDTPLHRSIRNCGRGARRQPDRGDAMQPVLFVIRHDPRLILVRLRALDRAIVAAIDMTGGLRCREPASALGTP